MEKQLIDLGVDESILNDVINLFNSKFDNLVNKSLLDEANNTILKLQREINVIKNLSVVDTAILNAGGRNVKAIRALFDEGFIESLFNDENFSNKDILDKINNAILEIKKTDYYLFNISDTKKYGTGIPKSGIDKSNKNCIDDIIINSARVGAGLK